MKKNFLNTTALASFAFASCINVSPVVADIGKPSLNVNGSVAGAMYFFKNEASQRIQNGGKGYGTAGRIESARINFDVQGSTNIMGGLDYSILVGLSADRGKTNSIRETRLKFEGNWGTLSFGNTRGPDSFGVASASRVMGALGGFNGSITSIINVSSGVLWSTSLTGSMKDAVKLVYLSPRVDGFQFGFGFTPNGQQSGGNALRTSSNFNTSNPFDQSNWSGLVSYNDSFSNGLTVSFSLSGIVGQTKSIKKKDGTLINAAENSSSWAVGTQLGYDGWELGVQYIDNGKSHTNKTHLIESKAGTATSIGLGYSFGAHKLALGYYHSEKVQGKVNAAGEALAGSPPMAGTDLGTSKADVFSLTYDLKVAPGLGIFAEANYFDMKTDDNATAFHTAYKTSNKSISDAVKSNNGHALLIGTKIKF